MTTFDVISRFMIFGSTGLVLSLFCLSVLFDLTLARDMTDAWLIAGSGVAPWIAVSGITGTSSCFFALTFFGEPIGIDRLMTARVSG